MNQGARQYSSERPRERYQVAPRRALERKIAYHGLLSAKGLCFVTLFFSVLLATWLPGRGPVARLDPRCHQDRGDRVQQLKVKVGPGANGVVVFGFSRVVPVKESLIGFQAAAVVILGASRSGWR